MRWYVCHLSNHKINTINFFIGMKMPPRQNRAPRPKYPRFSTVKADMRAFFAPVLTRYNHVIRLAKTKAERNEMINEWVNACLCSLIRARWDDLYKSLSKKQKSKIADMKAAFEEDPETFFLQQVYSSNIAAITLWYQKDKRAIHDSWQRIADNEKAHYQGRLKFDDDDDADSDAAPPTQPAAPPVNIVVQAEQNNAPAQEQEHVNVELQAPENARIEKKNTAKRKPRNNIESRFGPALREYSTRRSSRSK